MGRGEGKKNPELRITFQFKVCQKLHGNTFCRTSRFHQVWNKLLLSQNKPKTTQNPELQPLGRRQLPANHEALLGCVERQRDLRALCALSLREVGLETASFQVDIVQGVTQFQNENIFSYARKLFKEVLEEIINPSLS